MKNLIFLVSANFPEIFNNDNFSTIITISIVVLLVLLSDKVLAVFERIWSTLSSQIYESNSDSFSDFTSLDQTTIQVVTDIKIKFEDVAGNDEAKGELKEVAAKDRTLVYFDWQSFHSGTKCISNGWRWFGRVSRNSDRVKKVTNEIRVNAQVYLEFPMEGW